MKIVDFSSSSFIEEQEIWVGRSPKRGDHIRVSRMLYNHHGIFISNQEVIHFTGEDDDSILDWSKNKVISTNLERFLLDGTLECKEYTNKEIEDLYPVDHIVDYARACLNDDGYNLIFNNCEHFANVCTLGRYRSLQVEKFFNLLLQVNSIGGRRDMGVIGWIKNLFSGKSSGGGNRSTSSTTYEPDKVKIAEIEQESKIRLAGMEMQKIELMKNARMEVLEREHYLKEALLEAEARGWGFVTQTIVAIQTKLDEVTEKRLEIIEKGSLSIIKEIEGFYAELGDKISEDNDVYNQKKLPLLLDTLNKFEKDSTAFKLYEKRVDEDMAMHVQSINRQLENLSKRQDLIINGFLKSKDKIIEQTSQITTGILNSVAQVYINGSESMQFDRYVGEGNEKEQILPKTKQYLLEK